MTSTRSGDLGGEGARPSVGIAMVNWNGAQDVVSCFESLRRLRYQEFGVVLCDNASSDGSIDVLVKWASQVGWPTHVANHRSDGCEAEDRAIRRGDLKLVIVRNYDNAGFARGTNIAMHYALASGRGYRYLWALNVDTVVEPDALEAAVRVLDANPRAGSVQSRLVSLREPEILDSAGMRLLRRGGTADLLRGHKVDDLDRSLRSRDVVEVFGCCAASAFYRADALAVVGMFDESLFSMSEDVDLACRLRKHGFEAFLAAASVVHHKGGISRDRRKTGRLWWLANRNKLRIVARWYPRALAVPILVFGLVRALGASLRSTDLPLAMWAQLSGTLLREWRGGEKASVRRRTLRLGAARTIV